MRFAATAFALLILAVAPPPSPPAPADGDVQRGERAYAKCYGCHSLEPGRNANGPSLHNIVGRPVAAVADYPYSAALRALAGREPVWTAPLLDRFIADAEAVAPGTYMGFFQRMEAGERADLIAYLGTRR